MPQSEPQLARVDLPHRSQEEWDSRGAGNVSPWSEVSESILGLVSPPRQRGFGAKSWQPAPSGAPTQSRATPTEHGIPRTWRGTGHADHGPQGLPNHLRLACA
mmetsp:Transcript_16378/g.29047  ORF Transcript_16378/g.29047 Transcript_16378/m.29047 type:complete len:103 (-) Transcript_16378:85-393(-)